MTTRYSVPSVEPIQEDSEDEARDELRGKDEAPPNQRSYRHTRPSTDRAMSPTKASTGKERERSRRHKSSQNGGKHPSRSKGKNASMKKESGPHVRGGASEAQRIRHRRTFSNRSSSSTSSSSEEDEPVQDHREVLAAARARLTSPSLISTFTSLTSSTNKSSGSSGSNSTVTQASITKRSGLGKRPEISEAPMSPAVPDPPDVFAFLETDCAVDDPNEHQVEESGDEGGGDGEGEEQEEEQEEEEEDEQEREEQERGEHEGEGDEGDEGEEEEEQEEEEGGEERDDRINTEAGSRWHSNQPEGSYNPSALPHHLSPDHTSTSSSASSSFHGSDHFSEPVPDIDTDRSTSPERSVRDHVSDHEADAARDPPTDRVSAKIASQMAAAQQRQNLHGAMQNFGTPNMQRGNVVHPHVASTALSPRYAQHAQQHSLPRAEKLPVTGYELLASRLSSYKSSLEDESGLIVKPIYRKFGALNHRLLLHLQDELSELEEELHRLDSADTQYRRAGMGEVVPASRRAAAMQGGELEWRKTDILGRIGFKLGQYNQALSAFNTTQSLSAPAPADVDAYREYLSTEHPIAEAETRFLDPADDLVSICSSVPPSRLSLSPQSQSEPLSRSESQMSTVSYPPTPPSMSAYAPPSQLQGLAVAMAVAVLVPILTFNVIPGFIGRLTVVGLVASGVAYALMQAGVVGRECFGREGLVCGGIYGGVMAVIAGIM